MMQTDVIAIGGTGITFQIEWPKEITQNAYNDLEDQLDLLKKRAKRAITEEKTVVPSTTEGCGAAVSTSSSQLP